ncbi:MAG: 6-phospho-3-hexuloisomerase [Betaproteobacteria bacterium]
MSTAENLEAILAEMRGVFARMPADAVPQLAREIANAHRVLVYGVGRTGLVLQAFAMRLMHLGLDGHYVGQLSAPPIRKGDLLLTTLAVGRLPTADALIGSAKAAGARIVAISARPELVQGADVAIPLPAQTMADPLTSILPLGSPFEVALALLCDLTVVELMAILGRSNADLAARHANLL